MKAIGNFLWFILGGVLMGIAWWIAGIIMYISVIGIPFGKACFVIGSFAFFPFGSEAVNRKDLSGKEDVGTSGIGVIGNVLWFVLCGWWLALGHAISGVSLILSIIGIPFAVQHFKLAGVSLAPIGKTIVDKDVAEAMRKRNAKNFMQSI